MDLTTTLDELARSTTKVFLDGSIMGKDYNLSSIRVRAPNFSDYIGAKGRVVPRCGNSFGFKGMSIRLLNRQKQHVDDLLAIIRDHSNIVTVEEVLQEYKVMINHLQKVVRTHKGVKSGHKETALESSIDAHEEIYRLLDSRLEECSWPELERYMRKARLHEPRRNIFQKNRVVSYSSQDAKLVVAAMMECFDPTANVAIVTGDFDNINAVLNLGEEIVQRRLPSDLAYLHDQELASLSVYFPSKSEWNPGKKVRFMSDSKLGMAYELDGRKTVAKLIL